MNVAMVSEHASPLAAPGGAGAGGQNVHVAALSRALAGRGHTVTVYTRRDAPDLPVQVDLCPGVRVRHLDAGPPRHLPKDELLPVVPELASRLADALAADPPDLLHSHFWMSGLAAVAAVAAASGPAVPVVHTYHALGVVKRRLQGALDSSPPQRIRLETALGRTVDHIIATCEDEVSELQRLGVPRRSVSVVPCGVDTRLFRPEGDGPPRSDRPLLVAAGRMVPRTGFDDAIRALPHVPGARLVIAGGPPAAELPDDPEACRLLDLAARARVADRVRLLGRVSHHDLPALFQRAHLAICTPWYEPVGLVPLEAMACGVPVVASAVGGLRDTVLPGITGEHVPPRSPGALARVLRGLLRDPVRLAAYRIAAVDRARSAYTWEQVAGATERVYFEVLAGRTDIAGRAATAGATR